MPGQNLDAFTYSHIHILAKSKAYPLMYERTHGHLFPCNDLNHRICCCHNKYLCYWLFGPSHFECANPVTTTICFQQITMWLRRHCTSKGYHALKSGLLPEHIDLGKANCTCTFRYFKRQMGAVLEVVTPRMVPSVSCSDYVLDRENPLRRCAHALRLGLENGTDKCAPLANTAHWLTAPMFDLKSGKAFEEYCKKTLYTLLR